MNYYTEHPRLNDQRSDKMFDARRESLLPDLRSIVARGSMVECCMGVACRKQTGQMSGACSVAVQVCEILEN